MIQLEALTSGLSCVHTSGKGFSFMWKSRSTVRCVHASPGLSLFWYPRIGVFYQKQFPVLRIQQLLTGDIFKKPVQSLRCKPTSFTNELHGGVLGCFVIYSFPLLFQSTVLLAPLSCLSHSCVAASPSTLPNPVNDVSLGAPSLGMAMLLSC